MFFFGGGGWAQRVSWAWLVWFGLGLGLGCFASGASFGNDTHVDRVWCQRGLNWCSLVVLRFQKSFEWYRWRNCFLKRFYTNFQMVFSRLQFFYMVDHVTWCMTWGGFLKSLVFDGASQWHFCSVIIPFQIVFACEWIWTCATYGFGGQTHLGQYCSFENQTQDKAPEGFKNCGKKSRRVLEKVLRTEEEYIQQLWKSPAFIWICYPLLHPKKRREKPGFQPEPQRVVPVAKLCLEFASRMAAVAAAFK